MEKIQPGLGRAEGKEGEEGGENVEMFGVQDGAGKIDVKVKD